MSLKTGDKIESLFTYIWYGSRFAGYVLLPLAILFYLLSILRKLWLTRSVAPVLDKPVIVVGNITVGGTGKTPLVIALVEYLKSQGLKPGVISRGYGGSASCPYQLNASTTAVESGDEPLLIYQRCACPVVVSPDRVQAAKYLLANNRIDIIISDDGLQHYALPRQLEIVVVDGERGLGNRLCLPAGPLRETASRLDSVDMVVINGGSSPCITNRHLNPEVVKLPGKPVFMQLQTQTLKPLVIPATQAMPVQHAKINAVAAIGNPGRFFSVLEHQGYQVIEHVFPDHYHYMESDLIFDNDLPVIMTEKDAVKCSAFTGLTHHWYLPVTAILPEKFWEDFAKKTKQIIKES